MRHAARRLKEEADLLLVDHRSGRISLVRNPSPDDFRTSVHADVWAFFESPRVITSIPKVSPEWSDLERVVPTFCGPDVCDMRDRCHQGSMGPRLPESVERVPDIPLVHRAGPIDSQHDDRAVQAAKGG